MVEVFKTDITDEIDAARLLKQLQHSIPEARISFDLEDCDNILKVENDHVCVQPIIDLLQSQGFYCEVLE